jgi:hypothetical protein
VENTSLAKLYQNTRAEQALPREEEWSNMNKPISCLTLFLKKTFIVIFYT